MGNAKKYFPCVEYAYTTIPTYPSGQIGFLVANSIKESCKLPKRNLPKGLETSYYNQSIHQAFFGRIYRFNEVGNSKIK